MKTTIYLLSIDFNGERQAAAFTSDSDRRDWLLELVKDEDPETHTQLLTALESEEQDILGGFYDRQLALNHWYSFNEQEIEIPCPALAEALAAMDYLMTQTVDADLAYGIELSEGEAEAREQCLSVFAKYGGRNYQIENRTVEGMPT